MSTDKYIIESEGAFVEIDGEKWMLVLLAIDYGSPEAKTLVSDQVWKLRESNPNLVTGIRKDDGSFGFAVSPEFEKKIQNKIKLGVQWKKVRLYPA